MEALIASYGDDSSDSDSESPTRPPQPTSHESSPLPLPLPPPPLSLLNPPNSLGALDNSPSGQPSRVRSFPHRVARVVPGLHVIDVDVPLDILCKDDDKLEQVALGREFHITLGRTVPIRVHQIDSVVTMLRQRLQFQRPYWIDFNKWEVFVNDDCTRTFMSMEITATGLAEVRRQIQAVNGVYKLHNLPEFYKDPRPHISLAWASGDISNSLKTAVQEQRIAVGVGGSPQKCFFTSKFSGIECRIGDKTYKICKFSEYWKG
ncbi:hypothetical protein TIFTF001_010308 [Ficus carica]|uniref:U6 snRNA phosphodiesterase n=1 Tax=Ficus carica TaxID=3494 RepID=A0AA87ZWT1_FICCA|nr:hypothetical protein TIFTF001_010308 [Ficus carica]